MLPDIAHAPRILPNYTQHIQPNLKKVRTHPRNIPAYLALGLVTSSNCSFILLLFISFSPVVIVLLFCLFVLPFVFVSCLGYQHDNNHLVASCRTLFNTVEYIFDVDRHPFYFHVTSQDLDNYIRSRAPVTFLSDLRGHLQVS